MSSGTINDTTEDVNDFLQRIRELGDKRDKEDEERTRKLEEEILQGRKERQARRAERARSISPTKDSPLSDLPELRASRPQSLIDPPLDLQPSTQNQEKDTEPPSDLETEIKSAAGDTSTSQDAEVSHERVGSGGDPPSGSRTLSWQRRPTSSSPQRESTQFATPQTQDSGSNPNTMPSEDESTPSRAQISQVLSSKDPSWFRQTPDRGIGSPAFRRNAEETMSDVSSTGGGMRLPGLSRESSAEPEKATNQETGGERSRSPSRASSTFGTSSVGNRYSSMSSVSTTGGLGSPVPLSSSQRFEARKGEASPAASEVRASTSSGRSSPERSVSPTKGLGGFVQSAMMKRSDSISKRWSAQGAPGRSRGNSIVTNRSGIGRSGLGELTTTSPADAKTAGESSPLATSRPDSSNSEATVAHQTKVNEEQGASGTAGSKDGLRSDDGFVRPSLPSHARSLSIVTKNDAKAQDGDPQTPKSPTKSMDPKRWSPTKATWLESALNRPESPRAKSQVSQQPAWMRELNKARQSKSSVDHGKPTGSKEGSPVTGSHSQKPSTSGGAETISGSETASVKQTESDSNVQSQDVDTSAENKTESPSQDVNTSAENKTENPQSSAKGQDEQSVTEPTATRDTSTRKIPPPVLAPKPSLTLRSDVNSPKSPKSKQQPGVIDFRANLRRREVTNESSPQEEPEFKNVFGKLRKTERSNYVAPDELKENIMRGKASLNATPSPKKTQRVDDLKESILKQKEAIKAGGGSVRRTTNGDERPPSKAADPIPEAITRRNNLSRGDSIKSNTSRGSLPSPAVDERGSWRDSREQQPSSKQADDNEQNRQPPKPEPVVSPTGSADAQSSLQEDSPKQDELIKRESDELLPESEAASVETMQKDSRAETIGPVRPLPSSDNAGAAKVAAANKGLATRGSLAERLNPALANVLSRGPPPLAGREAEKPSATVVPDETMTKNSPNPTDLSSSTPLTHMTKNRAKGPKRRLPGSTPSGAKAPVKQDECTSMEDKKAPLEPKPLANMEEQIESPVLPKPFPAGSVSAVISKFQDSPSTLKKPGDEKAPVKREERTSMEDKKAPLEPKPLANMEEQIESPVLPKPFPAGSVSAVISKFQDSPPTPKKPGNEQLKPAVTTKSPELKRSTFGPSAHAQDSTQEAKEDKKQEGTGALPSKRDMDLEESSPKPDVIQQKSVNPESPSSRRPTPPPKSAALSSSLSPASAANPNMPGNSSPSPGLTAKLRENFENTSPLQSKIGFFQSKQNSPQDKVASPRPEKVSPSPPVPPKKVDLSLDTSIDPRRPSVSSPVPRTSESARVISYFFNTLPRSSDRVNIDPQLILTAEPDNPKTRTIRKQIWEITGDGKKHDLPVNQEYILFEGSMYLCVHVFESNDANKTEVYLWCGDEVGDAAIDDAQLFARKVARENGCKLEILKQGKETANFIQALGGIIITRRGTSSRSNSSSVYMLCGRRHLGQIAFDEVDFSRRNLCSGFPFVISARFGKLYLWKGKGSGADEIGGARLIGMDLGLTGEIEEVSEGNEPESFFDVFPDSKETVSYQTSGHWHLKPSHEKYRCRLLRVDHELGQRVGFWNLRGGSSSPVTRPNDTVQEIEPFCQKDLRSKDIYVLDAFFEIYVIVGEEAYARSAEFASALVFAQEYGILAASLQDRPFIPKSFVAIGGVPDACKMAFRKWDRRTSQTSPLVLPLNAAIEAIRS
ncbi:hypothetical protein VTN77DRAFT_7955 [Rasamsonia byssochlamydoides]|uniref:uncharacterized protein n=1 Tax=Rasamsonia byssochlamydoides TaxID=89139 RepID=UPI0037430D56